MSFVFAKLTRPVFRALQVAPQSSFAIADHAAVNNYWPTRELSLLSGPNGRPGLAVKGRRAGLVPQIGALPSVPWIFSSSGLFFHFSPTWSGSSVGRAMD